MPRLADELYTWRRTYRMSQQAAADLLNVSLRQYGRWEREEQRPNEDNHNTIRWLIAQPPPGWVRDEPGTARP